MLVKICRKLPARLGGTCPTPLPRMFRQRADEDRLKQPRGKFHVGIGGSHRRHRLRRQPHCGNLIGLLLDMIHPARAWCHNRRDEFSRSEAVATPCRRERTAPPHSTSSWLHLDRVIKRLVNRRRDPITRNSVPRSATASLCEGGLLLVCTARPI